MNAYPESSPNTGSMSFLGFIIKMIPSLISVTISLAQLYGHSRESVVVVVKEFKWDQRSQPLQYGLIHHSNKIDLVYKKEAKV